MLRGLVFGLKRVCVWSSNEKVSERLILVHSAQRMGFRYERGGAKGIVRVWSDIRLRTAPKWKIIAN